MKKVLFILFSMSYLLIANQLPSSISTTISKVTAEGEVLLSSNIPKGMSAIVVHNYGNGLSAITHTAISTGDAHATIGAYKAILHEKIPTIQTAVTIGDKVIFGSFYNNAMVIAPNQIVYNQITKSYKKNWLHPDAFALEFMKEEESRLSFENLHAFAQKNQIGLVLIVTKDKMLILDPISEHYLGALPISVDTTKVITPFYARFEQMDTSVFGFGDRNYLPYFQSVAGIK